ncbi:MAG: gliding motility-associated C-terminal domain-containing protein [Paludibacteraceae bacterium]|nr:gliding motility-associated C-terminal domain-containing protein [Paludibacteraceae bacterium]
MRKLGGNIRNWMVLGALLFYALLPAFAVPYNGCPDFMDLDASYVDLYTGHLDQPFDSLGRVEERHRLYDKQGVDPNTGGKLKFLPEGESKSVRLGNDSIGAESEAIAYHYIVDPDNSLLFVNFAVVLEDPGHDFVFQPRFVIRITDKEGNLVNDCSEYDVSAAAGLDGFQDYQYAGGMIRWRDWSKIGLDLSPFIGQEVQVQFITYDCFLYGHFGYAYFTASCAPNKLAVEACNGSSFSLAAPEGFSAYRWENGDTTRVTTRTMSEGEMNIYCEITSATGCQFTQSAYVSDHSIPQSGEVMDTICQGEPYDRNLFNLPPQMNVGTFGYNNIIVDPTACSSEKEVNLQLTVIQTYYPIVAAICEGEDYVENGFSVIHPPVGVYMDTLRYKHHDGGCDSVVCLRLEVSETNHLANEIIGDLHPCVNSTTTYYVETDDNLSRYTWTLPENVKSVGGANSPRVVLYFTDDTSATLMITGENGCGTSAVPITITPRPSYHIVLSDTICQGASYDNGAIQLGKQNQPGLFNYTYSFETRNGCDSSVVLSLSVLPLPQASIISYPENNFFCDSAEVLLAVKKEGGQAIVKECDSLAVAVGDIYCSDGSFVRRNSYTSSGKRAEGVVFYVDDAQGLVYVVGKEELNPMVWSIELVDIPGIENQMYLRNLLDDMNGYGNTSFMRNQGDASYYPPAWEVDYANGWYIPSIGELRKLFSEVDRVNVSLSAIGGELLYLDYSGPGSFYNVDYASSTEYNGSLVCCFESDFKLYAKYKSSAYRYRSVRSVKLPGWSTPQYKIGDLVENPDGSKGIVCYLAPDGKSGTMVAMTDLTDVSVIGESAFDVVKGADMTKRQSIRSTMEEWSGYENTQALRQLGDATLFPAVWRVDFEHGWYLPSVAQMNHLYVNANILDSSLVRQGGDELSYNSYWTSTYYGSTTSTAYGWYINMAQGDLDVSNMMDSALVRPMRDFVYCDTYEIPVDSSCFYKWNTGDTTPSVMVYPHQTTTYEVEVSAYGGICSFTLAKDIYVQSDEPIVTQRTICHGQTYKDDYFEATESGTYTREVENGACKQTMVLDLEVLNPTDTLFLRDVACLGMLYQKNGFNIKTYAPGMVYDTIQLTNHKGCDSVLCIQLEVLPASRDTYYARVCQNEPYRQNGFDIPAFQPATLRYWERTESASDGCMVIHVLGLAVDTVYQISMVDSACYMTRYQKNGFDFLVDEEGYSVHYLTHRSVTQCDSVVALRVKAIGNHSHTYGDTVMFGDTYRDRNFDLPAQRVPGLHTFDTTYVDVNGCDSIVVLELYVRNDDEVNIPTSFTPTDGNGINDIFMEGYELYVYDRYGLLVCHSNNGWDGSYRGAPADAGVYIYTIRFRNGKEKHGTVEIIKN